MDNITEAQKEKMIKELVEVGAQYGYSRTSRHSTMKPFIFGFKNNTAIIDLELTLAQLNSAKDFMRELGQTGKKALLIGTKNEAKKIIAAASSAAGLPYVVERWIGGTLTNFKEIKKRIDRMKDLLDKDAKGELAVYTKKERNVINKELGDLERNFGGIVDLIKEPDAIIVIDPNKEKTAMREAVALKIPIIALASSDCDISEVIYPIVANDSARTSIKYFVEQLVNAYREGLSQAVKEENKEEKTEMKKEAVSLKKQ